MMSFGCLNLTELKGVAGITTISQKLILANIFDPFIQLNLRELL